MANFSNRERQDVTQDNRSFEFADDGTPPVSVFDVFRLRCEARTYLCGAGQMELAEAVDGLQEAAISSGLVCEIGQDAVQAIMAEAFKALAG